MNSKTKKLKQTYCAKERNINIFEKDFSPLDIISGVY